MSSSAADDAVSDAEGRGSELLSAWGSTRGLCKERIKESQDRMAGTFESTHPFTYIHFKF